MSESALLLIAFSLRLCSCEIYMAFAKPRLKNSHISFTLLRCKTGFGIEFAMH